MTALRTKTLVEWPLVFLLTVILLGAGCQPKAAEHPHPAGEQRSTAAERQPPPPEVKTTSSESAQEEMVRQAAAKRAADEEQAKARDEQKEREAAERAHAANLAAIQEVERGLKKLTPKSIDDAQLALYRDLLSKLTEALKRPPTNPEDSKSMLALLERMKSMLPAYEQAEAAAAKRAFAQGSSQCFGGDQSACRKVGQLTSVNAILAEARSRSRG